MAWGTLYDPANYGDCNLPSQEFYVGPRKFRYVYLYARSAYGANYPALMYMAVGS